MESDIFGYMRFSYLGRSDAKLARSTDDLEQRKQVLYDPERLEERFYFFEKICLPSLRWQTDKDFRFTIFTSPELPRKYKKQLARSVRDIPQIEIVYDRNPVLNRAIDSWIKKQDIVHNRRTLHFRLDDDDALASDFIATLRRQMANVPDHALITRPSGVLLVDTAEGPELLAKFEPNIAIGFAIVNPPGHIRNPYNLKHGAHYRTVPALSLPGPLAYIHTAHAQSDTIAAQWRKINHARGEHALYFGDKPRRFKQAIERHFGGCKPSHFLDIMRRAPSRRSRAKADAAITQNPPTRQMRYMAVPEDLVPPQRPLQRGRTAARASAPFFRGM